MAFQQALPPRVRWEAEGSSHPFRSRSPAPRAAASTLTRGSGPASAIAGSRQGCRAGSIQIPRTRWRPRRSNGLKRRAALLLFAVTVVGILVLAVAVNLPNLVSRTSNPPPPPPPAAPQCKASQGLCIERTVTRVIDGDTLDVEGSLRIRLVLVDAPEPSQAGGSEAQGVLTSLCLGKLALIDEDDFQIGADPYGRVLAVVHCGGANANAAMISSGLADTYYEFCSASEFGNEAWTGCSSPPPPPSGDCDAAYPDVCIPPPPPDLDCIDVPHRNFRVLPPDPHRFDSDRDGVGCEG